MFWTNALDGPWTMVLGAILLVTAWLLWRGHRLGAVSRKRDTLGEAHDAVTARERAEATRIDGMMIRLEEFRREVEATIDTRLRVLERLTTDADREIARLIDLIAEARGRSSLRIAGQGESDATERASDDLPGAERETIRLLHGAGFEADEIARLVDQPTALVAAILDETDRGLADAA